MRSMSIMFANEPSRCRVCKQGNGFGMKLVIGGVGTSGRGIRAESSSREVVKSSMGGWIEKAVYPEASSMDQ